MNQSEPSEPRRRRRGLLLTGTFVILAALGACSSKTTSTAPSDSSAPGAASSPAAAADSTIAVVPDPSTIGAFKPASVTIKVGQTVAWDFQDANPHTATADDNSFTSVKTGLAGGQKYTHTFDKAGSYPYHCAIHPQMKATVVVQ